jgi:hypothetical protein
MKRKDDNVKVELEKINEVVDINYGDVLFDKEDKIWCLLVRSPKIALVELDGQNNFEEFEDFQEARSSIENWLDTGEFIHYPQSKYSLKLVKN